VREIVDRTGSAPLRETARWFFISYPECHDLDSGGRHGGSQRRYEALTAAIQRPLQSVSALGQEQAASRRRLTAAIEQERAGRIGPEAALEARLRGDTLALQTQIARLRVVQLQPELLAMFGALDIDALSRDFRGA
jgi:hypothetical protein